VLKKRKHCSPDELEQERVGDCWDHVAFDPEHRLVLAVVFGRRSQSNIQALVQAVHRQLEGRVPRLITTDGYSGYAEVFQRVFGTVIKPTHRKGEPNPGGPKRQVPEQLTFATVTKVLEKGRVAEVKRELVLGSKENLKAALEASSVSRTINTSFVERHNATDRHFNARKHRRSYSFSKEWDVHRAAGYFVLYSYNFCWCVRTLRIKREEGTHQPRTPAMAARLSDHVWSMKEWLGYPAVNRSS
jgi:IS1 family transposase